MNMFFYTAGIVCPSKRATFCGFKPAEDHESQYAGESHSRGAGKHHARDRKSTGARNENTTVTSVASPRVQSTCLTKRFTARLSSANQPRKVFE